MLPAAGGTHSRPGATERLKTVLAVSKRAMIARASVRQIDDVFVDGADPQRGRKSVSASYADQPGFGGVSWKLWRFCVLVHQS
jgi:hypothetical protein